MKVNIEKPERKSPMVYSWEGIQQQEGIYTLAENDVIGKTQYLLVLNAYSHINKFGVVYFNNEELCIATEAIWADKKFIKLDVSLNISIKFNKS